MTTKPKITGFDRATCRALQERVLAVINEHLGVDGIQVQAKPGSFTSTNYLCKLEFAIKPDGGVAETTERIDFKRYCARYGLTPEHLDKEFSFGGTTYRIIGAKPRSTRHPLLVVRADGKRFKFDVANACRGFGLPVPRLSVFDELDAEARAEARAEGRAS